MLYDHSNDPDENLNVVNSLEYKETVKKMKQLLKTRLHEASLAMIEK